MCVWEKGTPAEGTTSEKAPGEEQGQAPHKQRRPVWLEQNEQGENLRGQGQLGAWEANHTGPCGGPAREFCAQD